jgi:hypothetical protein
MATYNASDTMPTDPREIIALLISKLEEGATLVCQRNRNRMKNGNRQIIIEISNHVMIELLKHVQLKENVANGEWKMQNRIINYE